MSDNKITGTKPPLEGITGGVIPPILKQKGAPPSKIQPKKDK